MGPAVVVDADCWVSEGTQNPEPAGLYITNQKAESLPLKERSFDVTILCDTSVAEVVERHTYTASEDHNVSFKFPVPPRSAVFRCSASFGDKVVRTQVKKKETAEAEFHTAQQQGHSAVLVKQETGELLTLQLGNLSAGTECIVELHYLRLLNRVAGALEFSQTITWVPPCASHKDAFPDVKATTPVFAQKVSYRLSLRARVLSSLPIKEVVSATHAEGLAVYDGAEASGYSQIVEVSEEVSEPSKDFSLLVELENEEPMRSNLQVQRVLRGDKAKTVALATFVPSLSEDGIHADAAPPREVWLVVDCSGSMGGEPEVQARDAALMFVKGLPADRGLKFNLVVFGSRWEFMHPSCVAYDAATQRQAAEWVQRKVNDSMGGTEILGTFGAVYDVPVAEGHTREIIFLTDGGVSWGETERIYTTLSSNTPTAKATHVFCLGIGHGVHMPLLEGMSQRTGGVMQCVRESADIALKTGYLSKCALRRDVLRRPRLVARGCLVRSAPHVLPPVVFPGEPFQVLGEIVCQEGDAMLELVAEGPSGRQVAVALALGVDNSVEVQGESFAVLHAMSYIGSLLAGTSALHQQPDGTPLANPAPSAAVEAEVVRVAVEEGLVTPHTAAVGVLLQRDPLDPAKVSSVEIPLQVPHGRKLFERGGEGLHPMSFPCAPMAMPCAAPQLMLGAMPGARSAPQAFAKRSGARMLLGGLVGGDGARQQSAPAPCAAAPMAYAPASPVQVQCCMLESGSAMKLPTAAVAGGAPGSSAQDAVVDACAAMMPGAHVVASQALHNGTGNSLSEAGRSPGADGGKADLRGALRRLTLMQSFEGYWPMEKAVLREVLSVEKARRNGEDLEEHARGLKPASLADDEWATVLVLAFFRKYLDKERALWDDLECKAIGWLKPQWRATSGVGATILGAMKLV